MSIRGRDFLQKETNGTKSGRERTGLRGVGGTDFPAAANQTDAEMLLEQRLFGELTPDLLLGAIPVTKAGQTGTQDGRFELGGRMETAALAVPMPRLKNEPNYGLTTLRCSFISVAPG